MSEMRTKFDVEKKEQENAFLKNENELKEKQKRNVLIGSSIIIALLIIAGVMYYLAYRRKQESKLQREVIRERERGLAAVFEATEEERKRIAKDLHDGIGQQLSGLRMNWESFSEGIGDESQKARLQHLSGILDEACKDVRTISHQMMPRVLTEGGLLPALQDMLSKSFALTKVRYRIEHFKVESERFNERLELGLYRICQELINNIIKHSGADDVVIQLYRNKNQLILIVEDNGKGFDAQQKRDGIGLMNITSRLSTVGGDVIWEPGPQSGSVATVRIPLNDGKA
jgi:signal transduction histidine kinase